MAAVKEDVLQFGDQKRLVGILTRPAKPVPGLPAILIPNTGVEHRVGPNRLHVHLCRALADIGFPVLRIDLSGMGDSRPSPGGKRSDAVDDQRAALDELARLKIADRFAVIGLCSGGNDGHLLSCADPRVVAGVYIDHYAYPTSKFRWVYWRDRLFDVRRWKSYIVRRLTPATQSEKEAFRPELVEYFVQPTAEAFSAQLDALMARKLALMFVFTGEIQNVYNYREQLVDGFPNLKAYPRLSLHYMPDSDHTFTRIYMRQELIREVLQWAQRELLPPGSNT